MSMSDIAEPYIPRKKTDQFWQGDVSDKVIRKIFPPMEDLMRVKKAPNGEPLTNLSDARIKIILIVSGMSGGKSKLVDYIISEGVREYGREKVNVRVSRDLFSLIGRFDKETQEFYGGNVSELPINIFVHDDALSQLGRDTKKGVIDTFDAIFNNTRHLVQYQDEYGNKKGLVVMIMNMQDLHTLHVSARKNYTMIIYKTMVKNEQNYDQFAAKIPKKGLQILEYNTSMLDDEDPDESWKSKNVVYFGHKKWGEFNSKLVAEAWCYDGSPYWAGMLQDRNVQPKEEVVEVPQIRETSSGGFTFAEIKNEEVPLDILKEAWEYGKDHPYIQAGRAKYREDPHWYATYDYFINEKSAGVICEGLGLEGDTMLTNGYSKGGYVAIVIREQIGHWIEIIIPKLIKDIKWNVVTGQGMSDLKDDRAFQAQRVGVGIHGEIKTRRKKETPNDEWLSTEMKRHMKMSGKGYLYQLVIRRKKEKTHPILYTYEVSYDGNDKIKVFDPSPDEADDFNRAESVYEINRLLKKVEIDDMSDIFT